MGEGKSFPQEAVASWWTWKKMPSLIPTKALRDEGASYHYVAPSRYIEVDSRALTAIETVLKGKEIPYQEVMTWSTDGFIEKHLTRWPIALKKGVVLWRWSVPHLQQWLSFVM